MTDRTLPHACAVANQAIHELHLIGSDVLAMQLAAVHRATCDLVHALHAEREAPTESLQADARRRAEYAIARLRSSTSAASPDAATARALTLGELPASFNQLGTSKPYSTT